VNALFRLHEIMNSGWGLVRSITYPNLLLLLLKIHLIIKIEIFTEEKEKEKVEGYIQSYDDNYILFLSSTRTEIKSEYAGASSSLASLMSKFPLANKCIHTSSCQLLRKH